MAGISRVQGAGLENDLVRLPRCGGEVLLQDGDRAAGLGVRERELARVRRLCGRIIPIATTKATSQSMRTSLRWLKHHLARDDTKGVRLIVFQSVSDSVGRRDDGRTAPRGPILPCVPTTRRSPATFVGVSAAVLRWSNDGTLAGDTVGIVANTPTSTSPGRDPPPHHVGEVATTTTPSARLVRGRLAPGEDGSVEARGTRPRLTEAAVVSSESVQDG